MQNVLLLGAGLVTRPLVNYLLDKGYQLTIATRTVSKAVSLVGGHPNGTALTLDLTDPAGLDALIEAADLVISLVPYTFHVQVAKRCIAMKKNMVTSSYVSPAMKDLDAAAKDAGIIILNEIGVDPGIDHMSAMKVIHKVQSEGGRVRGFRSSTGGLPAPADNDNPWGYKFSWSPRGVLMAGRNAAKWLEDGELVEVPGEDLFLNRWPFEVEGIGVLEVYPNRDSMGYIDLYGLEGVETMFRGTLRYPGWCVAIKQFVDLGWLDMDKRDDLVGKTYAQILWQILGQSRNGDLRQAVATKLDVSLDHDGIERMSYVGLFSEETVPAGGTSYLDALCALLEKKLAYAEGERDMLAMVHQFDIVAADGTSKKVTSTMVDYGIPDGNSSMSRTVSLPAAIATHMILNGDIKMTGVHVPVIPEIYEPVLGELDTMDIKIVENWG